MIVDTLPVFYYEKLVGYMPSSFVDLVFAGERIEVGLKRGKFNYDSPVGTSNRRVGTTGARKKEGDTHAVTSTPAWPKSQPASHGTHQYAQYHSSFAAHARGSSALAPVQPRTPAPPPRVSPPAPAPTQSRPNNNFSPSTSYNVGRSPPAKRTPEFAPIPIAITTVQPYGGSNPGMNLSSPLSQVVQSRRNIGIPRGNHRVLD